MSGAVGPVSWGGYPGEYLEQAMAVYVAQEHHATRRRVPASGDGGIDLMIPDGDGYEVRQVKRFHERLTTKQKAQIEKSYRDAVTEPRLSRPITRYRLVMPLDLTPDEQEWLDNVVSDAPWPVEYLGEVHWHDLAAKHPHVTDYFFRGGSDRIVERSLALQQRVIDPTVPLTPDDVANSLTILQTSLNNDDPFYRYDLITSATDLEPGSLPVGVVFAKARSLSDGTFITITITPKYPYALEDRPIGGTITVEIADPEEAKRFKAAYEDFHKYGTALSAPMGTVKATLDAPGGLGGTFDGGAASIGPSPIAPIHPSPMRLVTVDRDGVVVAELRLPASGSTRGAGGGGEVDLTDDAGVLRIRMRFDPPDDDGHRQMTMNFQVDDIVGQPVVKVLPTLRLLNSFQVGNTVQLRGEVGATVHAALPLNEDGTFVGTGLLRHIENLAVVQDLAHVTITVPEEVGGEWAQTLDELLRMRAGEVLTGTWTDVKLTMTSSRSRVTSTLTSRACSPWRRKSPSRPTARLSAWARSLLS